MLPQEHDNASLAKALSLVIDYRRKTILNLILREYKKRNDPSTFQDVYKAFKIATLKDYAELFFLLQKNLIEIYLAPVSFVTLILGTPNPHLRRYY
jgi:hypothetical protein